MPRTYWDDLQLPQLLTLQDGFEASESDLLPGELHFILELISLRMDPEA
jgi:hypothetical protein